MQGKIAGSQRHLLINAVQKDETLRDTGRIAIRTNVEDKNFTPAALL